MVIVTVPAPTMVAVDPEIETIAGLEELNVKAPVLVDDGAVRVNDGSPNVLTRFTIVEMVGFRLSTVKVTVAVVEPPAFVAVMVNVV